MSDSRPLALLAAVFLAVAAHVAGAEGSSRTFRYLAFDSRGRTARASSLSLRDEGGASTVVYRKDGGYEQSVELSGDERLLYARYRGPDAVKAFSVVFDLGEGKALVRSEGPGPKSWKPSLRDGDESLFFLLPRLIDLRAGASRTSMTIVRAEDSMRATFIFECLGLEKIDVGGEVQEAYEVRMAPADFILRVLWPYANRYFFRASDLVMLRFEGPDAERRMGRIDLQSTDSCPKAEGSTGR
jgi:hypothetical protein